MTTLCDPLYRPRHVDYIDHFYACTGCGAATSHGSGYCASCRTNCAICADWLQGEPEMCDAQGGRVHIICEATKVLESLPVYSMSPAAMRAERTYL